MVKVPEVGEGGEVGRGGERRIMGKGLIRVSKSEEKGVRARWDMKRVNSGRITISFLLQFAFFLFSLCQLEQCCATRCYNSV